MSIHIIDQHGAPLTGIGVHVMTPGVGSVEFSAETDLQGNASLPVPTAGTWSLEYARHGVLWADWEYGVLTPLSTTEPVGERQTFTLKVPPYVYILPVDDQGNTLTITQGIQWQIDMKNRTSEDEKNVGSGSSGPFPGAVYPVYGVRSGLLFARLCFSIGPKSYFGWTEVRLKDVEEHPGSIIKLPIPAPSARVHGIVCDDSGNPVPNFRFTISRATRDSPAGYWIANEEQFASNPQGGYCTHFYAPGDYQIAFRGSAEFKPFLQNVSLKAGADLEMPLRVQRTAAGDYVTVVGTVTDPAGRPLAGVNVRQGSFNSPWITDAAGHWSYQLKKSLLGRTTMGHFMYTLTCPGYVPMENIVDDAEETATKPRATMYPGRKVRLRLLPGSKSVRVPADDTATDPRRISVDLQFLDPAGNAFGESAKYEINQPTLYPKMLIEHKVLLPVGVPLTMKQWYFADLDEPAQWFVNGVRIDANPIRLTSDTTATYEVRVPVVVATRDQYPKFPVHLKVINAFTRKPINHAWMSLDAPQTGETLYSLPDGTMQFNYYLGASRFYFNAIHFVSISQGRVQDDDDIYLDADPHTSSEHPILVELLPILNRKKISVTCLDSAGHPLNLTVAATTSDEITYKSNPAGELTIYQYGPAQMDLTLSIENGRPESIKSASSPAACVIQNSQQQYVFRVDFSKLQDDASENCDLLFPNRTASASRLLEK